MSGISNPALNIQPDQNPEYQLNGELRSCLEYSVTLIIVLFDWCFRSIKGRSTC